MRKSVEGRQFAVKPTYDAEIEDLPAAAVPAALHDVVRELPGGSGAGPWVGGKERLTRRASRRKPPRYWQYRAAHAATLATIVFVHAHPHAQRTDRRAAGGGMPLAGRASPLKHDDVRALPVFLGKRQLRLDDFFDVEGDGSDEIEIRGDVDEGEVDRPRHDPRADPRRRQRRDAPRRVHEGRRHRGDRQRVGLGRRRDVRRDDSHPRQRRRATRLGLPRQPVRHERRDDPGRRLGRDRTRHADEARAHRGPRPGPRLRRACR